MKAGTELQNSFPALMFRPYHPVSVWLGGCPNEHGRVFFKTIMVTMELSVWKELLLAWGKGGSPQPHREGKKVCRLVRKIHPRAVLKKSFLASK
jgi:hypothetical protein